MTNADTDFDDANTNDVHPDEYVEDGKSSNGGK